MIDLRTTHQIRAAEENAFRLLPDGTLMQRASFALSIVCARLLADLRGAVVGSRVVVMVGSGNNGGDALWAGAMLTERGVRVDALLLSDRHHEEGADALLAAGGRLHPWQGSSDQRAIVAAADLVVDGILGIGGAGGLRANAAELVASVTDAVVVAVDVPSGVDADTGLVPGEAVSADVTVTFGAAKPGLLVAPGSLHAGTVQVIDIDLEFDDEPAGIALEAIDVAPWIEEPDESSYKYRRGVVGLAVGSGPYPGAGLLATSAARHGNVGMVRFLDRSDGVASMVVSHYPDVVIDGTAPADQVRTTAWACGSGFPGTSDDEATVLAVLDAHVPVVLDAGALTVVAESPAVRDRIQERSGAGLMTVLTPHDGEFERLQPGELADGRGRIAAAQTAASGLGCCIVLKGPGTIVADRSGAVYVDTEGTADLAVAGSGDVLAGILGAVLADAWANGHRDEDALVEATAAGVWLHGCAGRLAGIEGPVTAPDIAAQVAGAVRMARFGGAS